MHSDTYNEFFVQRYDEFILYAKKALLRANLFHDPEVVVGDAYLYGWERLDIFPTEPQMIAVIKNWIKMNIIWTNSPYRRSFNEVRLMPVKSLETYMELDWDYETLKAEFVKSLTPKARREFSIYTEKNLRKGREVALHLNCSTSGAYRIIRSAKRVENQWKEWCKNQMIIP